jgi:hypothetical protein
MKRSEYSAGVRGFQRWWIFASPLPGDSAKQGGSRQTDQERRDLGLHHYYRPQVWLATIRIGDSPLRNLGWTTGSIGLISGWRRKHDSYADSWDTSALSESVGAPAQKVSNIASSNIGPDRIFSLASAADRSISVNLPSNFRICA